MTIRIVDYSRAARRAIEITQPFFRELKDSRQHLLVLGDSTMYGAGIKDPGHTIGGLLAAKYPDASVETLAQNGARVMDLEAQLQRAGHTRYDLVVVGVGGNDIVRFSSYSKLSKDLTTFLATVSKISDEVVICHSVNLGNIGFFLFPLNYLFDYRSRRLSQVYTSVTAQFPNVQYANFYRPMNDDHYTKATRSKFIAEDGFHPSDYANQYFFNIIYTQLQKSPRV